MPSQSHLSKAKILATPTDTPYHALIASPRASPARSWQQMMRARLGIDKTKSWADWAEEEEEAAEPTKTFADAKSIEVAGEVLGMRLRGGGPAELAALTAAVLTVGGRIAIGAAATQPHAQGEQQLLSLDQLGLLLLLLLRPVGPRLVIVDADTSTHHLLPTAGARRSR